MRSSRNRMGAKPVDLTSLRPLFETGAVWSAIGVVRARDGNNSHFKQEEGDVLVDVDLSPEGTPVWCRLGGGCGGQSIGSWRIPPVDTEVGVLIPDGHVASDPMIVCALSSGGVPDELDADTLVITNGDGLMKLGGGTQFAALANLVKERLDKIQSKFDAHTHSIPSLSVSGAATGTGTTGSPSGTIGALDDVAAQNVKIK